MRSRVTRSTSVGIKVHDDLKRVESGALHDTSAHVALQGSRERPVLLRTSCRVRSLHSRFRATRCWSATLAEDGVVVGRLEIIGAPTGDPFHLAHGVEDARAISYRLAPNLRE